MAEKLDRTKAKLKINTAKNTLFKVMSVIGTPNEVNVSLTTDQERMMVAAIDDAINKLNEARELLT